MTADLHSPSRCMTGAPGSTVADAFAAGVNGTPLLPWSCGCSCRRCRLNHRPDSPRPDPLPPVQGPPTLDEAYSLAGVWHLDDDCETCDERAAAARRGEW